MKFLLKWLIGAVAIVITAYLLPGVTVTSFGIALIAALVIGLINTFIKPILFFFTLPINILTLGLFTLVLNALLIMLADAIVAGFEISTFWWAILFSLVLSIVSSVLSQILAD
jgi:putative membrane protein